MSNNNVYKAEKLTIISCDSNNNNYRHRYDAWCGFFSFATLPIIVDCSSRFLLLHYYYDTDVYIFRYI